MDIRQVLAIYEKEREYETCAFGDYRELKSLNFGSFILIIEAYIQKVKTAYTAKWDKELPPWLLTCKEFQQDGNAPVKAYEELIKVMALAGAALEAYTQVDVTKWREDIEAESQKWKE